MDSSIPPIDPEDEPTFPAGQALQLCELVKRWEIAPRSLLAPFGLSERELEDPHRRIRFSVMGALIERARTLTGEPVSASISGCSAAPRCTASSALRP